MPGVSLEVALSEALEIKGEPLSEPEIWGVLCQSAEALQDLFIKDEAFDATNNHPTYLISPDTLMLCGNGRVQFAEASLKKFHESKYAAPEAFSLQMPADIQLEKVYIFGLGMTLYCAADYKQDLHEKLKLSEELDTLLYSMCEDDPSVRITLTELLDACGQLAPKRTSHMPYSHFVMKLYKLVFGSLQNLDQVDQMFGSGVHREDNQGATGAKAKSPLYWTKEKKPQGRKSRSSGGKEKSRQRSKSWNRGQGGNSSSDSNPPGGHSRRKQNGFRPLSVGPDFPMDMHGSSTYDSHLSHSVGHGLHHQRHQNFLDPAQLYYNPEYGHNSSRTHSQMSRQTDLSRQGRPVDVTDNSIPLHGPGRPLSYTGSIQDIYERLRERRKRLEALRNNLFYDEPLFFTFNSDTYSNSDVSTEYGDRRSLLSSTSYNQGVFRPDLNIRYGTDTALRMRRARSPDHDSEFSVDFPLEVPPGHPEPYRDRSYQDPRYLPGRPRSVTETDGRDPKAKLPPPPVPMAYRNGMLPQENDIEPEREEAVQAMAALLNNEAPPANFMKEPPMKKTTTKRLLSTPPNQKVDAQPQKQRKFYGPEFIAKSSDPHIRLTLPTAQNVKNINSLKPLQIVLLNGQIVDLVCEPSTTGKQLFDLVANHLALPEHFYFGLTYISDGEHLFLDHETKLSKVAPTSWKDQKGGNLNRPFTLYLRVKFYAEKINELRHSSTKHLYYLQLRRDVLEERAQCNEDDTMQLASIALQAEYGDFDPKTCSRNYFQPEHYVPPRIIRRVGTAFVKDKLPSMHKSHHGMEELEAEMLFLKEMQLLSEYGIHFYKIFKSKQDRTIPTYLGVGAVGISIAEKQNDTRVIVQGHQWSQTKKLSFNRKRFSVLPKSDVKNLKIGKLSYYTESYRKGRYLLQFSTQQHNFQMKLQTRSNITDMIYEEMPMDFPEHNMSQDNMRVDLEPEPEFEDYPSDQEQEEEIIEAKEEHGVEGAAYQFSDPSYYQNVEARQMDHDERELLRELTPTIADPRNRHMDFIDHSSSNDTTPRIEMSEYPDRTEMKAFIVDASVKSGDQTLFPTGLQNETVSDTLQERFNNLPPPDSLERRVVMVHLPKDPEYGIGITIVGGENTSKLDLGIFIKSITPDGPAEKGGVVHAGDRIIAVNGKSLEGMPHHKAVEIIRDSPSPVELLVSQPVSSEVPPMKTRPMPAPRSSTHTPRSVSPAVKVSAVPAKVNGDIGSGEESDVDMPVVHEQVLARDAYNIHTAPLTGSALSPRMLDHSLPLQMGRSPVTAMMDKTPTPGPVVQGELSESTEESEEDDLMDNIVDRGTSMDEMATLQFEDRYEVVLQKVNGSLGLNVTGGVNTSVRHGGIYVKSMVPNGAADLDKRILIGDRVLEVNNVLLSGVTHKQAVETLRNTPDVCRLVMERGVMLSSRSMASTPGLSQTPTSDQSDSDKDYSVVSKENTFIVELDKGQGGLGFSIIGGRDSHTNEVVCIPRVKKIFANGPAAASKKMDVGDIILEVNDTKVKHLTHNELIGILRAAPHRVKLKLCRPLIGILPSVVDIQGADASVDPSAGLSTTPPSSSPVDSHDYHAMSPVGQSVSPSIQSDFPESSFVSSKYGSPAFYSDPNYETYLSSDYYTEDKSLPQSPHRYIESASSVHPASSHSDLSVSSRDSVIRSPLKPDISRPLSMGEESDMEDDPLSPGEFEVTLVKEDGGGLGFKVAGGADSTDGCYIKAIVQEPALSDGQLQPGDKLMMVNGADVSNLDHYEAVNYLRGTPQVVTIRAYRPPVAAEIVETSALITPTTHLITESAQYHIDTDITSGSEDEDTPTSTTGDQEVPTVREVIADMESSNQSIIKPHTYGRKSPSENREPQILNNGALDMVVPERVSSVESIPTPSPEPRRERSNSRPYIPQSGVIRIELEKNPGGSLGFGLVGGEKGSSVGIFVKSIAPGGPADEDGRMKVGDRLLEINGENLIGMNPNKAVAILRKAKGEVTIAISRPPSRTNSEASLLSNSLDEIDSSTRYVTSSPSSPGDSQLITPQVSSEVESEALLSLIDSVRPMHERQNPVSPCLSEQSPGSPLASPRLLNSHDSDYDLESTSVEASNYSPNTGLDTPEIVSPGYDLANGDVDLEITAKPSMYDDVDDDESSFGDDDEIPLPEGTIGGILDDNDNTVIEDHRREIPEPVTDSWLDTLPTVKVADNGLYRGKNLESLIEKMVKGLENEDPAEEYKSLRNVEPTDARETAQKPDNKPKNRYRNVLPYDANFINLSGPDYYINASDINVTVGKHTHHYIACQGPLPNTTEDFWRMVWEYRASVIAMTTLEVEAGKVKCHRYWPEEESLMVENKYEVTLKKSEKLDNFIINTITMKDIRTDVCREIIHLNYTTWPDHGTPTTSRPLLKYMRLMHLYHTTGPIIVHCSAGIGRTGALLTIDLALAHMETDLKFDIPNIVKELREQRQGMIQTKDQYVFCYLACLEALNSLLEES